MLVQWLRWPNHMINRLDSIITMHNFFLIVWQRCAVHCEMCFVKILRIYCKSTINFLYEILIQKIVILKLLSSFFSWGRCYVHQVIGCVFTACLIKIRSNSDFKCACVCECVCVSVCVCVCVCECVCVLLPHMIILLVFSLIS